MAGPDNGEAYKAKKRASKKAERVEEKLLKMEEKYVEGELAKDSYKRLKERYTKRLREARIELQRANTPDGWYSNRLKYAVNLLSDLSEVYERASLEGKDARLDSIFPGTWCTRREVFESGAGAR